MKKKEFQSYEILSSQFYDIVNGYADEKEISFFADCIAQTPGRTLEAMCGSGRLLVPLRARGICIDGVDASSPMLERCRQRLDDAQLTAQLYEQQLELLDLPYQYSTVIIAMASFQLIIDRQEAIQILEKLRAHMSIDGNLFIDLFKPTNFAPQTNRYEVPVDAATSIRATTQYQFDEIKKIAQAYTLYERLINGVVQEQENELIQLTWYTDEELMCMLAHAGFELVRIHDVSFGGSPARVAHAKVE